MENTEEKLTELRKQIDDLDKHLLSLINKRAEIAIQIGKIKRQTDKQPVFYRPEREAQIIEKIIAQNPGPIANKDIAHIFRLIMGISRSLQQPLTVAFLGPEGTFSHAATIKQFGPLIKLAAVDTINKVFEEVEKQKANYGVVPVENSTEGIINQTLDELIHTPLKICGEIVQRIHQHLLINPTEVNPDAEKTIQRIYSHPQSLAQCRQWLNQHFPTAEKIAVSSNAQAAKLAQTEKNAAAVAGDLAAELYNLHKLAENIEDNMENSTRFLILGTQEVPSSGNDKTTILAYAANQPGVLAEIVMPFAKHSINITLPTLRPSGEKTWNYIFFFDIEGHINDKPVRDALAELTKASIKIRVLGSYPRAIL